MSDSPGSSDPACLIDGKPELPIQHGQLIHPDPRVVKVPCKIMLDLMLEELALPKARYDNHTDERGRVSTVVTFYMSAGVPGNLLRPVKMGGAEAADSETAEDSAAKEAIRIVETWENMEVEDLHYSELKYVKKAKEDLHKKLEAAQGDMKKLHIGLCLASSRMIAFSNQIYGIIHNNQSLGQDDTAEAINRIVQLFEGVAADLGHAGRCLEKDLKTIEKFLYIKK